MRRFLQKSIYSGPQGTTKVMIGDSDNLSSYETFQLINNRWILRDIFDNSSEAVSDALHGAGLLKNPENLFNLLPMLRNPAEDNLFNLLPMLRKNPKCCSECGKKK